MMNLMMKIMTKKRLIIWGLLVFGVFTGFNLWAADKKQPGILLSQLQVPVDTLQDLSKNDGVFQSLLAGTPLTLSDLIRRVVSENQQVQMQKTDWQIRQAEAEQTRSIFEPEFKTSLQRQVHNQRNSVEESLSRGLKSTYSERNWNYDAAVHALAPTGGEMKLGYNLNQLSNSLTRSLTSEDNEYQMYLGATLTQPLLKDAGSKVTKAGIMAADLESSAAFQEYRLKMMQRAGRVAVIYWDYYQAQKKLELREDSLRIAKRILNDNRERFRTGKMAETEVLEAEIGVNNRQSLLTETEHERLKIANQLRNLLALTGADEDVSASETVQLDTATHQSLSKAKKRSTLKRVFDSFNGLIFAYGESSLTPAIQGELDKLAADFKDKENLKFRVVGHTDSHGLSPEKVIRYKDNVGLGRARALSVAEYLVRQLDLDENDYSVESRGAQAPVALNNSAAGRAKNRRVEIFLSYDDISSSSDGESVAHSEVTTKNRQETKYVINSLSGRKFDESSTGLTDAMEKELDALIRHLHGKTNLAIRVIGHTDSYMLSPQMAKIYGDNFGLGQVRAQNTVKYLALKLGLKKHQIESETGGPFEPVTSNATREGRAKNRRVEIVVSFDEKKTVEPEKQAAPKAVVAQNVEHQSSGRLNVRLDEPTPFDSSDLDQFELTQTAFVLRPEYLAAKKKLEQADVKITYAKNQLWPKLDLLASYGLNGLDFNTGDSWEQLQNGEYASWSAGLELSLPLRGGIEGRSKLKKSKLEKRRQLMQLKEIEIELKNRIETAIDNVRTSTKQLHYARQIIGIQKKLLDIEMIKLKSGQSSSRVVLEKEENFRSAREDALVSIVNQQRALIELELASGRILKNYDVDLMETEI